MRAFLLLIVPLVGVMASSGEDAYVMIGKDKLWNAPRPEKPDLSVQYIMRSPHYPGLKPEYVKIEDASLGTGEAGPVTIVNEGAQRWPAPGESITYTVVVRNVGARPAPWFNWHWMYDGRDVEAGRCMQRLAPDEQVEFILVRPWEAGRHYITFQVDRAELIDEISEENNWVIDPTDALSYAFFVEESVREEFQTLRNGLGSYDFVDWAQFQVRQCNKEFRDTIYPSSPGGIQERVRLDRVFVIPDGWGHKAGMHTPGVRTPVNFEEPELYNANDPPEGIESVEVFNNVNGGVDGVWGFTVDLLKEGPDGKHFYTKQHRWVTGSEWPLHHELGHQLGRIDNYLICLDEDANAALPGLGYRLPEDVRRGMMHHGNYAHDHAIGMNQKKWDSTYRFYSEHTAASLNRDLGRRRGLFGEYLFDVPAKNTFTFYGMDRRPIAGAKVDVFIGKGLGYRCCGMNEGPTMSGFTNARGEATIEANPWPHVFIWGNNGVIMFHVYPRTAEPSEADEPLVGFLDITDFNLAYWRGHADHGEYLVLVKEPPAGTR